MNFVVVLLWGFSSLWAAYLALTVSPVLVPNLSFENAMSFSFHFASLAGVIVVAGLADKYLSNDSAGSFADSRLASARSEGNGQAEGNRVVTSWGYVIMDNLDRWEVGEKMLETVRKELGGRVENPQPARKPRRGKRKEAEASTTQAEAIES